jgi:hypothetical protein
MNGSALRFGIAAGLVFAALGGAASSAVALPDSPAAKRYVTVLRLHYLPLRKAFVSAIAPCQRKDLPTCRRRLAASDGAAKRLVRALARTRPPARVAQAHRTLRRGVRDFAGWAEKYIAAIDSGDQATLDSIGCICRAPTADITNAIGEIADTLGVNLPAMG